MMWTRCVLSWVMAALLYSVVKSQKVTGRLAALGGSPVEQQCPEEIGYSMCMAFADARLLASFVLGAGLCHLYLPVGQLPGSTSRERIACCPDEVQVHRFSF
mmetsp:Transcript_41003/g.73761  ORF Transcript_41003/g.73761 Transcript_41003/m.73761 type:complete len:102 (+) Transcript_41003:63-368(+)